MLKAVEFYEYVEMSDGEKETHLGLKQSCPVLLVSVAGNYLGMSRLGLLRTGDTARVTRCVCLDLDQSALGNDRRS